MECNRLYLMYKIYSVLSMYYVINKKTCSTMSTSFFMWIFYYLIANVISASQATLPSTFAIPFPFPIGPFMRKISTSN